MFIDPLYLIMLAPAFILALLASMLTRTTFSKYARVAASSRMRGAEAAARLLERSGVRDVTVERTTGFLSDHYDPRTRTLRLSDNVYNSHSLAAIGVACHEAGHAIQHAQHYAPLGLRSALVPVTQIGTLAPYIILPLGFILGSLFLIKLGIALFALVVLFALVTLPVEWDASARAKRLMVSAGIVSPAEQRQAGQVLNAAFLTYVAAAVSALLTLLYFLLRSGLLGARR
ncbi:MAG: zinc metallopeptidase [Lentisphaerae bacterium]|nr:zinc metallopeptidase [Lentisphaerota bacterium]